MSDDQLMFYLNEAKFANIKLERLQSELAACRKERDELIKLGQLNIGKRILVESENDSLRREIEVLRQYGNKDCTAMADEVLTKERT